MKYLQLANVFWGQIVVALSAFIGIRFYTEIMRPADFGVAMLASGALALLDSIGVMALNQTLLTSCSPFVGERRRQIAVGLSWLFVKWAVPVAVLLGSCAAVWLILSKGTLFWSLLPLLMAVAVVSDAVKISFLSLVVLDRNYRRYSLWTASEALLTLAMTAFSLMVWRGDAIGYLVGYFISRPICTAIFIAGFSPRHLSGLELEHALREMPQALRQGAPVAAMGPLGWISSYLDRYIIGGMLGVATTGVYSAVVGLVSRPYALTTSVLTNYFRPLYFQSMSGTDGGGEYFLVMKRWLLAAILIGLMGCAAFWFLGDWLSRMLLAKDFRENAPTLMILFGVSQTFAIATHSADNALLSLRASRRLLVAQVVLAAITLVLIPAGIAVGGIVGGLLGRILAEFIKLAIISTMAIILINKAQAARMRVEASIPRGRA